jgi:hypothetical protein
MQPRQPHVRQRNAVRGPEQPVAQDANSMSNNVSRRTRCASCLRDEARSVRASVVSNVAGEHLSLMPRSCEYIDSPSMASRFHWSPASASRRDLDRLHLTDLSHRRRSARPNQRDQSVCIRGVEPPSPWARRIANRTEREIKVVRPSWGIWRVDKQSADTREFSVGLREALCVSPGFGSVAA